MNIVYNKEDIISHHGVAAVIKNENGEILMQEHVKYGFWTIPVGKVKDGQDVLVGLNQEIKEECNIDVEKCNELTVKDYFYMREGHEVKVTSHLFEIVKYSGEVKNMEPEKHKQQIFMPLKEIRELPYLSDLTLLYLHLNGFDRPARI
jgi:ADP-ribose pyrophosphatase YjhB (NUDIX family)